MKKFKNSYLYSLKEDNTLILHDIKQNKNIILDLSNDNLKDYFNADNLFLGYDNKANLDNIILEKLESKSKFNNIYCSIDLKQYLQENKKKSLNDYKRKYGYDFKNSDNDIEMLDYLTNKCKKDILNHIHLVDFYLKEKNEDFSVSIFNTKVSTLSRKIFLDSNVKSNKSLELVEPENEIAKRIYDIRIKNSVAEIENIKLGDTEISIGNGGLHTINTEFKEYENVESYDITSNYPNIIKHYLKDSIDNFNYDLYTKMLDERIKIKHIDKQLANTYKLFLNSFTGQLNSEYSKELYNQDAYRTIINNAQIMLVDLLESTYKYADIIQVNTDSMTIANVRDREKLNEVIKNWSDKYKMNLEKEEYKKFIQNHTNDYIALKSDNTIVTRGNTFFDYINKIKRLDNNIVKYAITEKILFNKDFEETFKSILQDSNQASLFCLSKGDDRVLYLKSGELVKNGDIHNLKLLKNDIDIDKYIELANYEYQKLYNPQEIKKEYKVFKKENKIADNSEIYKINDKYNKDFNHTNLADLLDYLGYSVIKHGANTYKLESHDSLILRGNMFYWNSQNLSGNAYKLLSALNDNDKSKTIEQLKSFYKAIENKEYTSKHIYVEYNQVENKTNEIKEVNKDIKVLNDKEKEQLDSLYGKTSLNDIYKYLHDERCIDKKIIKELVENRMIFTDEKNNICFRVNDTLNDDKTLGFEKVGTQKEKRFKVNTTKHNSFNLLENQITNKVKVDNIYIFESPIDLLSFKTLTEQNKNKMYDNSLLISVSGVRTDILANYITTNTKKLIVCTDNDKAGHEFYKKCIEKYSFLEIERRKSKTKDFNDDLKEKMKSIER